MIYRSVISRAWYIRTRASYIHLGFRFGSSAALDRKECGKRRISFKNFTAFVGVSVVCLYHRQQPNPQVRLPAGAFCFEGLSWVSRNGGKVYYWCLFLVVFCCWRLQHSCCPFFAFPSVRWVVVGAIFAG